MKDQPIDLKGKIIIVTGASQGIGEAIATKLFERGATIVLGSRRPQLIRSFFSESDLGEKVLVSPLDLSKERSIHTFVQTLTAKVGQIDGLVHAAGLYTRGRIDDTPPEKLDELYQTNLRGTYTLFHALAPHFKPSLGQLICLNSSQANHATAETSIYAAFSHGIKAITNAFREEHNQKHIKVASLFLGRTATPRMESIYKKQNQDYHPELLLQPEDVAQTVIHLLSLPFTAEITDLHIRPFIKSY